MWGGPNASAADTTPPPATIEQAAALHQAGELDAAEAAYRTLLKGSAAQRRNVLALLGLLYRQSDRRPEALAAYDQLLTLGERSAEVFLVRGDLLHGLGRNAAALQSYDRAIASSVSGGAEQPWSGADRAGPARGRPDELRRRD